MLLQKFDGGLGYTDNLPVVHAGFISMARKPQFLPSLSLSNYQVSWNPSKITCTICLLYYDQLSLLLYVIILGCFHGVMNQCEHVRPYFPN